MPTLLQRYKEAERYAYKRLTAHIVRIFRGFAALCKGFVRGGRQSVSILVVAHNEAEPRGFRLSIFGLVGFFLGAALLLVVGLALLGSVSGTSAKVNASNAQLLAAQAELDQLRQQTDKLDEAYKTLQSSLSPVIAAAGIKESASPSPGLSVESLFGKKDDDKLPIARMTNRLEESVPIVAEYSSMIGQINSVKHMVPAIWPIGGNLGHISQTFGANLNPFTGQTYFHTGLDCSTYRSGDPVVATGDGKVTLSGWSGGYGRCIIIAHSFGYMTRYGHMERLLVHVGDYVKQGQTIGILGSSGDSTGPHTHYEVLMGHNYLNPMNFLWGSAKSHPIIDGGSSVD